MRPTERDRLKRCLVTAATDNRVPYGKFAAARGVFDLLIDVDMSEWEAKEIAAEALDRLCVGDKGKFDLVACVGVMAFLDKTFGVPAEDKLT